LRRHRRGKVARLQAGEVPIHEPGLDDLIRRNASKGRLRFTTDADEGIRHGLFQFIAVGTPPEEDGSADLSHVLAVAETIGRHMSEYRIVVDKSTVPVGTADKVRERIEQTLSQRGAEFEFDVVSNPEFLKEGAAVNDFMKPDRVIVGTENPRTAELLKALYDPFTRNRDRMIVMDVRSAELTKYAANAMLATKISFMNEMANLAERMGADIEKVASASVRPAHRLQLHLSGCGLRRLLLPEGRQGAGPQCRAARFRCAVAEIRRGGEMRSRRSCCTRRSGPLRRQAQGSQDRGLGLAFKPNTDDMREAPARDLMEALWADGASVRAYDPVAMDEARRLFGDRQGLELAESAMAALQGADVLAILTEWQEFRSPDFEAIRDSLRHPVIFDGRNLYEPSLVRSFGLRYFAIGRGESALWRD
jgi:UDPglucose 6-dehydrogenase